MSITDRFGKADTSSAVKRGRPSGTFTAVMWLPENSSSEPGEPITKKFGRKLSQSTLRRLVMRPA